MTSKPSNARHASYVIVLLAAACGGGEQKAPEPSTEPAAAAAPVEQAAAAEPAPTPSGPVLEAPADPNEACGQIIAVSYKGADHAPETVTRSKAEAQARADVLLKDARINTDFAALAKAESDAPSSAPRGGVMGTFTKDKLPELHAAIKEPLFALKVNETAAQVIEAPYGFVLVHRCKVEKVHARHVLIRYKGAKNAGKEIKRSIEDARKLAVEVQQKLSQGGDFEVIAKQYSEDGSKDRGGDIGSPGRGQLVPPFEDALFALKVGELSTVVESEYGFHVIQRLPNEVAAPN